MKKTMIVAILVLLPIAIMVLPILLPIVLVYALSAINLGIGYNRMFCHGPQPTFKDRVIQGMENRGLPIPMWLKRSSRSCNTSCNN
ncbi:MAG: hypothetical protein HQL06_12135 [Nitrospirae bacterium]|nr:hypothetical protein [Nitrospirota bacterium]